MNRIQSRYNTLLKKVTTTPTPNNLVRYVYAEEGVGLYAEPYLYSEEVTRMPYGATFTLLTSEFFIGLHYKWYKTTYEGRTLFVSEKWIGKFPVPFNDELIENYAVRLETLNFEVEIEHYNWEDRKETKLLLPSSNMIEVYNLATHLYPLNFKFPKKSTEIKEILTKVNEAEDIYEEFLITRNVKGEVIILDYIADFGESSDAVTLQLRFDQRILLTFGSYCQGYRKTVHC